MGSPRRRCRCVEVVAANRSLYSPGAVDADSAVGDAAGACEWRVGDASDAAVLSVLAPAVPSVGRGEARALPRTAAGGDPRGPESSRLSLQGRTDGHRRRRIRRKRAAGGAQTTVREPLVLAGAGPSG